jgi:excisionase family DNA binding protein
LELLDRGEGILYTRQASRNPDDGATVPTATRTKKPGKEPAPARVPEILDVGMAAAFLTVSRDTVYQLFQRGELPGRKVGRKWVTTKAAVVRWLEHSSADDSLARAVERGDRNALAKAISNGKARFC